MSRALTAGMITAVTSKVVFPCMFAKIETKSGDLLLWTGFGNITWNSMIFRGVGDFGGVDMVEEAHDLTATSITFSLAGIRDTNLEIALNEIQQKGNAYLWFGALDVSGNLIADPYQLFAGFTDVPTIEEGDDTCTIKLSCESRLADLNRAKVYYYTPEDQKLFDATDKGFDYVAGLQNASVIFG